MTRLPPVPEDRWPPDPRSDAELAPFLDRVAGAAPSPVDAARGLAADAVADGVVVEAALSALRLRVLAPDATAADVAAACDRARQPDPDDEACPPLHGVCTWPGLLEQAAATRGLAALVGGFPEPYRHARRAVGEARTAAAAGATGIEVVCDHTAVTRGRYGRVGDRIVRLQAEAPVEIGALFDAQRLDHGRLRRVAWVALLSGARGLCPLDVSCSPALLAATWVCADVAAHYEALTGAPATVQPTGAGSAADAAALVATVRGVLGAGWRERFRLGGDTALVDALVAARRRLR